METVKPRPTSIAQETSTKFAIVELNLQSAVMLMGFGGRFASMPGLFVGIGLGSGCNLLLTCNEGVKIGYWMLALTFLRTCLHTNRTGEVVVLLAAGLIQAEPHLNLLLVIGTAVGVPEARFCNFRGLARTEIEIELLFLEAASAVRLQCSRLH